MSLLLLLSAAAGMATYTEFKIEGWNVRVETSELSDEAWPAAQKELSTQLYRIARVVPDGPLGKLRTIVIWVQRDDPATACAAYHPEAKWLKDHGVDPAMARGVEIANGKKFVSWTYDQPWMVMHELAHAYHHQFLADGFGNKEIKAVWEADMASKKYDSVLHWDGKTAKHYAENNPMEFFAECTEAYFGRNDFYPFINAELKTFDPEAYRLMETVWGKPQKRQ